MTGCLNTKNFEQLKQKILSRKHNQRKRHFRVSIKSIKEEAIPKNAPKRLSLPILFQLNKEKKEEEKPKILPKKLDKNKLGFLQ